MRILTVTPIKRGIAKDTLTYYTTLPVEPGALVSVPLRKKHIPALVLAAEGIADAKSGLKAQGFQLKKIKSVIAERFFTEAFMKAVAAAAEYFASTEGAVLASLAPAAVLEEEFADAPAAPAGAAGASVTAPPPPRERNVLQAGENERLSSYKKIIREEFAAGRSVFCIAPTREETRWLFDHLKKGVEQYCFLLNGALKKKQLAETWKKALAEKHPSLIVATGGFLAMPLQNIGAIIVENENSRSYKIQTRPYLDIRTFAELFARHSGARLIFGSAHLRTETLHREEQGHFSPLEPLLFRPLTGAQQEIIDMRKKPDELEKPFEIISAKLKKLVEKTRDEGERMFIYASRKGYAPMTLCRDCGEVVSCKNCKAPVVLHISPVQGEDNRFICHRCGLARSARETCVKCGGWRLTEYGVGIERIEQELRNLDPELPIFILDKDTAPTDAKAKEIADDFNAGNGGVLIGTETALHYIEEVDTGAVTSIDHLFSLPDFRIGEKILTLLLSIRSLSKDNFLIETRRPEEKIFQYVVQGDLSSFYRADLAERKRYGYPPFAMLVKISVTADEARAKKEAERVEKLFDGEEQYSFPAFVPNVRGKFTMHTLLKIPPERWPDKELIQKLRSLPPYFSIRVDPENLL